MAAVHPHRAKQKHTKTNRLQFLADMHTDSCGHHRHGVHAILRGISYFHSRSEKEPMNFFFSQILKIHSLNLCLSSIDMKQMCFWIQASINARLVATIETYFV